jgi:hypothetical protein
MDETPSKHAPNQGMGSTKLEFLSGYVENASTKYFLSLYSYFDKKFETFFYTNNEHFEGLNSWLAKLDDARNSLPSPFDVFDFSSLLREDDDNKLMLMIGPSPEDNIKVFNTVKDAILKGMQVVERDFPSNFICDLVIYGQQGEIEGSVYECRINESEVEILYDLG